jgi:predicted ATPase
MMMREYQCAEALAPRALELCEKHHFPNQAAFARCILGVAQAHLGRAMEGIALVRQGIANLLEVADRVTLPAWTVRLAEAQQFTNALDQALETAEHALESSPVAFKYRPEGFRVRGEIRARLGQSELAEADFRESVALAQRTSAKTWELRATMNLARLLASQNRRDEARTMLAEIYGWFTEGFDTADLKDAKALLDELNGEIEQPTN